MLATCALALIGACSNGEIASPDIVFVLTDDQRWDAMSCAGSTIVQTPNLDRLAREGVLFENALVVTSLCCPSRASILTGVYAHVHGVMNNFPETPGGDPLAGRTVFPELLQEAGYETAFIGKWHLPNVDAQPYRGFDHWISFEGQGEYFDQVMNVNGTQVETKGYSTDRLFDYALEWLRRPRTRPRFLMLSLKNCHYPYQSPRRHAGKLADARIEIPESASDPVDALPVHLQKFLESPSQVQSFENPDDLVQTIRLYYQSVLSIDDNVGRLLDHLEGEGQLDRTFFLVTSDNGLLWGEHGMTHKLRTFEPSIRVPLLVRYPPLVPAGERERRPALNIDLPSTFLDLAGARGADTMQGDSLLRLWKEPAAKWREETLHYEAVGRNAAVQEPMDLALRSGRWKYVRFRRPRIEELLFDLETDPDERENLAADPAQQERMDRMRAQIEETARSFDLPPRWLDAVQR